MLVCWFANVLIVVGMFLLGYKYRSAFLFSIAGECIWTCTSACEGRWDLASICAVFCVMAARNWWLWGKEETK